MWDADAVRYYRAIDKLPIAYRSQLPRNALIFDPGERWQYGGNIDWVGRAWPNQRSARRGPAARGLAMGIERAAWRANGSPLAPNSGFLRAPRLSNSR